MQRRSKRKCHQRLGVQNKRGPLRDEERQLRVQRVKAMVLQPCNERNVGSGQNLVRSHGSCEEEGNYGHTAAPEQRVGSSMLFLLLCRKQAIRQASIRAIDRWSSCTCSRVRTRCFVGVMYYNNSRIRTQCDDENNSCSKSEGMHRDIDWTMVRPLAHNHLLMSMGLAQQALAHSLEHHLIVQFSVLAPHFLHHHERQP